MASYTPNLNLYKPDATDDFEDFREEFNSNMDKIDGSGGNQNIAANYDETATYAVGDYVIYDGLLYKCDTAVTSAETFDPTKWTRVLVTDEMGGSGGSGGHTIYDKDGTALTQENGLQFTGAVSVSDDSVNGRTVIDVEGGGNYYLNTLYSTEEKKVGYWTDGKPLYQITIDCGSAPARGATKNIPHGISNLDKIIDYSCFAGDTTEYICFVPQVSRGNIASQTSIIFDATNINIYNGSGSDIYANLHMYCTIQYTKTTDTADPNPQFGNVIYLPTIYSEEERQVGVWTDGKPLYQKTINIASTTIQSGGSVTFSLQTLGIQNAEKIINADGTAMAGATTIPFNYLSYYSGTLFAITLTIEGDTLMLSRSSSSAITLTDVCITVQYTKTTDTPGSGEWVPSGAAAVHYSTNEQVIGTWIDGKPLYEITLNPTIIVGTNTLNHGIANLKECIRAFGKCKYNNGAEVLPLPYASTNIQYTIACGNVTPTTYLVDVAGGFSSIQDCYVTIQYTKTTD